MADEHPLSFGKRIHDKCKAAMGEDERMKGFSSNYMTMAAHRLGTKIEPKPKKERNNIMGKTAKETQEERTNIEVEKDRIAIMRFILRKISNASNEVAKELDSLVDDIGKGKHLQGGK